MSHDNESARGENRTPSRNRKQAKGRVFLQCRTGKVKRGGGSFSKKKRVFPSALSVKLVDSVGSWFPETGAKAVMTMASLSQRRD